MKKYLSLAVCVVVVSAGALALRRRNREIVLSSAEKQSLHDDIADDAAGAALAAQAGSGAASAGAQAAAMKAEVQAANSAKAARDPKNFYGPDRISLELRPAYLFDLTYSIKSASQKELEATMMDFQRPADRFQPYFKMTLTKHDYGVSYEFNGDGGVESGGCPASAKSDEECLYGVLSNMPVVFQIENEGQGVKTLRPLLKDLSDGLNDSQVSKFQLGAPSQGSNSPADPAKLNSAAVVYVDPMHAPETDPGEKQRAQVFVDHFVKDNSGLTDEAKAKLTKLAQSVRGPWGTENLVKSVTQEGDKITVTNNGGGASFYYLSDLN